MRGRAEPERVRGAPAALIAHPEWYGRRARRFVDGARGVVSLGGVTRPHASVLLLATLLAAAPASADPADRRAHEHDEEPARRHDYSRFSDGPRRVPAPRGASMERARALGLGTEAAASRLLHGTAPEAWTRAAAWRGERVERLLWPVDDGRFVRGYGYVRVTRPELIHNGVDISAPEGSVVRAAADGVVAYSDNGLRGYGNCVIIVHPNGWVTLYAHNSRTTVQPGWRVRRGERIALVGSTGISHGPHVHFELRTRGGAVDPLALFDGGPLFVRRVAERAAHAGRVPPPREPSGEDRREPPPLPPWRDEAPASAPVAVSEEGSGDDEGEVTSVIGGLEIGSDRLLRRLLRFAPTEAMTRAAGGRLFRNLLFPLRGGRVDAEGEGAMTLRSESGSAVRAPADGLVVYAGRVARRGTTVLVLHRMGWVTVLSGLDEVHVEAGQRVQRGEWIGAASRLELEVRVEGRPAAPRPMLVQLPAGD